MDGGTKEMKIMRSIDQEKVRSSRPNVRQENQAKKEMF